MKKKLTKEQLEARLKLVVYIKVRAIIVITAIHALFAKSYYTFFQCLLALFLFMLPAIIEKRFRIDVPDALEIIVILFIFSSIFLGEIKGYYEQYYLWDKLLHTSSGFLTAAIGFSLIDILNRSEKVKFNLSPVFVAVFAFCFSMTVGVLWEFFEFFMDSAFAFDMQKDTYIYGFKSVLLGGEYIPIESVLVNGRALDGYVDIGIVDTMNDLIVNAIGAAAFSIFGLAYITRRGKKNAWLENLMPRKINEDDSL